MFSLIIYLFRAEVIQSRSHPLPLAMIAECVSGRIILLFGVLLHHYDILSMHMTFFFFFYTTKPRRQVILCSVWVSQLLKSGHPWIVFLILMSPHSAWCQLMISMCIKDEFQVSGCDHHSVCWAMSYPSNQWRQIVIKSAIGKQKFL